MRLLSFIFRILILKQLFFSTFLFASESDQKINAELLLGTIERAKNSLDSEEDIKYLLDEIYRRMIIFNKHENKGPFISKPYKSYHFQKRTYFTPCRLPETFTGWQFRVGETWMNDFWVNTWGCSRPNNLEDHCCQGIWSSFICGGFIPCHLLQCALTPFIPAYYTGGRCCRLGFPISAEQEKQIILQYLNTLEANLNLYLEKQKDNHHTAPVNQKLLRD